MTLYIEGFNRFVTSTTAPIATGWSESCRVGFAHLKTVPSHGALQHSVKPGTVTIAGKLGVDVPIGTLNSILKQAGLKRT